ncbi:FAD-dependent monooxygenase [Antrihabitans stalagmiti]|uniref:FAD-dependent monooxygenase n=1 Tax=Antrihabitans stalagmiti TaxID=2799499 RepID=UPI001F47D9C5|nr:FAD-dependent monooxygenase [Antrihabitans stalagmiti]
MKAIVIGAGIGGLTTAIALRERGIGVEILEAAPQLRTTGTGLGLGPNAVAVLAALGIDLADGSVGQVLEQFELRTDKGKLMRQLPIRDIVTELGAPFVNLHRNELIAVLRAAAGDVAITFGAAVERYDVTVDGVSVTCADGRTASADVLIGADGIRSVVRAQRAGGEAINEYGYVCWLATIPFEHEHLTTGYAGHYWGRGQRFGLIDIGGGNAYWWGTKNLGIVGSRSWQGSTADVLAAYDGWASEVTDVIAATPDSAVVAVPAQDRSFVDTWGEGPVTLVGDAAHPMLTSLAQGAGSAIEDGYVLAHCLAATADPTLALRRYEDARRERTRTLVANSRRLSRIEQIDNPVASTLRNFGIRYTPMSVVKRQNMDPLRFDLPVN